MFRFKGRIKGVALRQLEIEPAFLWIAAELPAAKAQAPTSSAIAASDDPEAKILHFITTCRASAKQKSHPARRHGAPEFDTKRRK